MPCNEIQWYASINNNNNTNVFAGVYKVIIITL